MKLFWKRLVAGCVAAASCVFAAPIVADYPAYLILRAPTAATPHQPTHGYYPGYGRAVETSSYSYGWFGVKPRSHGSRHFGYYKNYTEWSWK